MVRQPHLNAVRAHAAAENAGVVVICNKLESEIIELDEEKDRFPRRDGYGRTGAESGDPCGIRATEPANLFHGRPQGSAVWTVRVGATAPEAAAVIHRLPEGLYPCRGDWLRGLRCPSW